MSGIFAFAVHLDWWWWLLIGVATFLLVLIVFAVLRIAFGGGKDDEPDGPDIDIKGKDNAAAMNTGKGGNAAAASGEGQAMSGSPSGTQIGKVTHYHAAPNESQLERSEPSFEVWAVGGNGSQRIKVKNTSSSTVTLTARGQGSDDTLFPQLTDRVSLIWEETDQAQIEIYPGDEKTLAVGKTYIYNESGFEYHSVILKSKRGDKDASFQWFEHPSHEKPGEMTLDLWLHPDVDAPPEYHWRFRLLHEHPNLSYQLEIIPLPEQQTIEEDSLKIDIENCSWGNTTQSQGAIALTVKVWFTLRLEAPPVVVKDLQLHLEGYGQLEIITPAVPFPQQAHKRVYEATYALTTARIGDFPSEDKFRLWVIALGQEWSSEEFSITQKVTLSTPQTSDGEHQ